VCAWSLVCWWGRWVVARCPLGGAGAAWRLVLICVNGWGIIACSSCVTADLEVRWPLMQLRLWVFSPSVVLCYLSDYSEPFE